jgi:hypothetical protein
MTSKERCVLERLLATVDAYVNAPSRGSAREQLRIALAGARSDARLLLQSEEALLQQRAA